MRSFTSSSDGKFAMYCGFQSNYKKVFDECTQYFISFDNFHFFAGGFITRKWCLNGKKYSSNFKLTTNVIHANIWETFEVLFKRYIKKIFIHSTAVTAAVKKCWNEIWTTLNSTQRLKCRTKMCVMSYDNVECLIFLKKQRCQK